MSESKKKKTRGKTIQKSDVYVADPINEVIRNSAIGTERKNNSRLGRYLFRDDETKTYMMNGHERKVIVEKWDG